MALPDGMYRVAGSHDEYADPIAPPEAAGRRLYKARFVRRGFLLGCLCVLLAPCLLGKQGALFSLLLAALAAGTAAFVYLAIALVSLVDGKHRFVSVHENGILVRTPLRRRFVAWRELRGFTMQAGAKGGQFCLLDYGQRAILPGIVLDASEILHAIASRADLDVELDVAGNIERATRRTRIEETSSSRRTRSGKNAHLQ